MFRQIRRIEKQLTIEECHEVLTKAEYGTAVTTQKDTRYPELTARLIEEFLDSQ